MPTLQPGDSAPDFSVPASTGETVSLKKLRGKKVVLYFYSKDNTPGCTKEGCGFRDVYAELQAAGAVVLGVSRDGLDSHRSFAGQYKLPFPLLTDPDASLAKAYGAYGQRNLYGNITEGVLRHSFLIDEEGKIVKAWRRVIADVHAAQVLAELQKPKK